MTVPQEKSPPLLRLEEVTFRFSSAQAPLFAPVHLSVEPGERWAVVGGEGAGKSTLMRVMAGLRPPTSGRCLFQGRLMAHPPPSPGGIGLLFRDAGSHFLAPTVVEEVWLGVTGLDEKSREEHLSHLLRQVGLPITVATASLARLSPSQQTRVAIATLLAAQPRLILADEPGATLDEAGEAAVAERFRSLCREEKVAQIIFTSRHRRAARFADRTIVLTR